MTNVQPTHWFFLNPRLAADQHNPVTSRPPKYLKVSQGNAKARLNRRPLPVPSLTRSCKQPLSSGGTSPR